MTNKVVDSVLHTLDIRRNSSIGITLGWQYGTEIVDKERVESNQYTDDDYSYYSPVDEGADTYNYDDNDPQYDYNTDP